LIRDFGVPKIGFVGPRAQPEALFECCACFVGEGPIVEIDARARNLATVFEGARCLEYARRPTRSARWGRCWRRRGWRRRRRGSDDGGRSGSIAAATATTTASGEAQCADADRCREQTCSRAS
jgi:hypothetical protein